MAFTASGITKMFVSRLLLQETGTYNPAYMRPYNTFVDNAMINNIANRIDDSPGTKVTGGMLSGLVNGMMRPTSDPMGLINIPNGWAEKRIRFVMEVYTENSFGNVILYYIQGYTNYPGITVNRTIAPDMEFIINSITTVSRQLIPTPMGMQSRDVVVASGQILSDHNWGAANMASGVCSMRPVDIFTGINANYIEQGFNRVDTGSMYDTRVSLKNDAINSRRNNNLPTSLVANVIDAYNIGNEMASFGQNQADIVSHAVSFVNESSLYENPFIRMISDFRGQGTVNSFYYPDLERIDPNVSNTTKFLVTGSTQTMSQPHMAGQTAYWTGTDMETVMATTLSNAVPALMMDMMITSLAFRSTNQDMTCAMNTSIYDGKSLMQADMTRQFELFKARFERELMYDLTFGNQEQYMLDMRVDLFGETWITLSLRGKAATTFVTPSFCDNLLTPVIAPSRTAFDTVVSDFDTLLSAVVDITNSHNSGNIVVNNAI